MLLIFLSNKKQIRKRFNIVAIKPFCIIALVVFTVLPGTAQAWFDGSRHGRPFSTRSTFNPMESSVRLAVYDDITAGDKGVVVPLNPFFVHVDTIDLDIPLTLLGKTPVSSMEALDRLIISNLRLKLLIDEYNALQKRADALLKSVLIPYLDSPRLLPEKGGEVSLNEQRKRLDSQLDGIFFDGHGLDQPQSDLLNFPPLGFSAGWVSGGKTSLPSNHPKASNPGNNYNLVATNPEVVPLPSVTSKNKFPWIFTFFLNAFSYCLVHRFETVFYGTILFAFGYLLSLKARHDK